jgi:hypothetical protein
MTAVVQFACDGHAADQGAADRAVL